MSRHLRMALVLTLVLTTTVSLISPAAAGNVPDWQETALNTSLAWLRTQQQADGSFPAAFGSPAGITCDVVLAAASVGQDPATWKASPGGPSAMDYLAGAVGDYATAAAPTGKLIVAVAAAGMDPADFGGHDLPSLLQTFHGGSGYGASAMDQAWAILGLAAIRHQVPVSDVIVLRDYQQANGGWEGAPGWGTDTNTTALAAQALIAAGEPVTSAVISNTLGRRRRLPLHQTLSLGRRFRRQLHRLRDPGPDCHGGEPLWSSLDEDGRKSRGGSAGVPVALRPL